MVSAFVRLLGFSPFGVDIGHSRRCDTVEQGVYVTQLNRMLYAIVDGYGL